MIIVNTISEKFFSINGFNYAKIYQPLKQGSQEIGIYNVNDTRQQLVASTRFDEFQIDGVVYTSQEETASKMLELIYDASSFDEVSILLDSKGDKGGYSGSLQDLKDLIDSVNIDGVKTYPSLAFAKSIQPVPEDYISFNVDPLTDASNSGQYYFLASEAEGVKFFKNFIEKTEDLNDSSGKVITAQAVKEGVLVREEFINESLNLWDGVLVQNQYIQSSGTNSIASATSPSLDGWSTSEHIPIIGGQIYTLSGSRGRQGLAFFTTEAATVPLSGSYDGTVGLPLTFVAPSNANFLVFNVTKAADLTNENLMLQIGNVATEYQTFGEKIKSSKIEGLEELLNPVQAQGKLKVVLNSAGTSQLENQIEGQTLLQTIQPFNSNPSPFDLGEMRYNGILVRNSGDDTAPYRVDDATIGANHNGGANNLNKVRKIYLDGEEITQTSGTVYGEKFKVVEYYDLDGNVTSGVIAKVSNIFEFDHRGATVIQADYQATQTVSLIDLMFLMGFDLQVPYDCYIPKSLPITHEGVNYDFRGLQSMNSFNPSARLNVTPADALTTGQLCDRVIQRRSDISWAIGYLPIEDAEPSRRRLLAVEKAIQISDNGKIYMSAVDPNTGGVISSGDYYSVVGYKVFFKPRQGFTGDYIIEHNGNFFAFYDWHSSYDGVIDLQEELKNKSFEVVEKSENVTLKSRRNIDGVGVKVNISNDYGYLILKF